jgi:5-enolpyruvylshikimate-3-phosphate synthase
MIRPVCFRHKGGLAQAIVTAVLKFSRVRLLGGDESENARPADALARALATVGKNAKTSKGGARSPSKIIGSRREIACR